MQARGVRLEHERHPLLADVRHDLRELLVRLDGVVAVQDVPPDAERFAAAGDELVAVHLIERRRDAVFVVHDDDEDRQLAPGAAGPVEARREVTLGAAGVAAVDDRDAVTAVALLREGGAGGDGVLGLDGRGARDDVPRLHGEVVDEVAAAGVGVGRFGGHLPDRVDHRHAHRGEDRGAAVVQVEEVVIEAFALVHEEAERDVERFFAGAADPEEAVRGSGHRDQPLFERA